MDQVRSFSSIEHNEDGFFQYFALDFNEASSAFHGSDILTQAGEHLHGTLDSIIFMILHKAADSTLQNSAVSKRYRTFYMELIMLSYLCCLLLVKRIVTVVALWDNRELHTTLTDTNKCLFLVYLNDALRTIQNLYREGDAEGNAGEGNNFYYNGIPFLFTVSVVS